MYWLALIVSMLPAFAEPAAVAEEPEFPRTAISPATTFWVLDTPTSGRWIRTPERFYTLEWRQEEDGAWVYTATECTFDEMRQAECGEDEYGGG